MASEPTQEQLVAALQKADAEGDTQAAQAIAAAIKQRRQQPSQQPAQQEPLNLASRGLTGIGETALSLGSGIAGQVAGGLRGIGNLVTGAGGQQAAQGVQETAGGMTYQPRTQAGQQITQGIGGLFAPIEEGLQEVGGRVTDDPVGTLGGLMAMPLTGRPQVPGSQQISQQIPEEVRAALGTATRLAPEIAGTFGGSRFLRPSGRTAPRAADPSASVGTAQRTLADAQQAGYRFAPTEVAGGVPVGGGVRRTAYGLGGKQQARQDLSRHNMEVTNRLIREDLDVPELSPAALNEARQQANKAYESIPQAVERLELDLPFVRQIEELRAQKNSSFPDKLNRDIDKLVERFKQSPNPSTQDTLALIRELRHKASKNIKNDSPEIEELGWAQRQAADAAEELIGRNLQAAGKTDELARFREARKRLAKIHTAEDAMNIGGGEIDPRVIQRAMEKGVPLDGNMELVARTSARFQNQLKPITQTSDSASVNAVDFYGGIAMGGGGAMLSPELLALGAVPALARLGARRFGMSTPPPPSLPNAGLVGAGRGAQAGGLFNTLTDEEFQEMSGLMGR